MANYSIRDLERLTGIKAHTIRIWEKRYRLIEPGRTSSNIRAYCDAELKKLINISILNRNGFKISRIVNLSSEEIASNIKKISEYSSDKESDIENLAMAMIDMDEHKFEKILNRSIIQHGFEDTITGIIMPFFVRTGVMWQTGVINSAQEHFISNLTRQKLMVATDSQITGESDNSMTFTLFLPEGELHEFGLLFANYMLRKRGHRVVYLGQNVPLNDLAEVDKIKPSDYMYTSFITSRSDNDIINYLDKLKGLFPKKRIYVTGRQLEKLSGSLPETIRLLHSPEDMTGVLNSLAAI
jgi:MerR family transcriptional regulator, light-induced transcriptional regulator